MTIDYASMTMPVNGEPSLRPFSAPTSVAVVGASNDPAKWGYWLARGALAGRTRRAVYLVNRTGAVLGQDPYPNLTSLPETAELVVVCVPATHVKDIIVEALALGSRAFLVITAGVTGELEIVRLTKEAGARLIGPNSLGLFDAQHDLHLAWGDFTPGHMAIASQSGQIGSELAKLGERAGVGISRFVSIGNQLDVCAHEILSDLITDERTRVVAVYMESFARGDELVRAMGALRAAGKQVLVLTTGASQGSRRLARSHTGSLTTALDVVDAACRAAGATRVSTPSELVDVASVLLRTPGLQDRRVAVLSDSGGQGGIAADVAATCDLTTPAFSPELQARLATMLPTGAATSNPVDLAGAGEKDLFAYAEVVGVLLRSGEVDAVVVSGYFGCYGEDTPGLAEKELQVADRIHDLAIAAGLPVLVHSMSTGSPAVLHMRANGIPTFDRVESAMIAASRSADLSAWPSRELALADHVDLPPVNGYWRAREHLRHLNVAVPHGVPFSSVSELRAASNKLNYPVVLKAGWLEHKSEQDGVQLGIASAADLERAFVAMHARLGDGEYVAEDQDTRPDVVEMLVGGRRDDHFGPVVVVGAGGVETELRNDVSVELAPVDHQTALSMIGRLTCLPLLNGWRGKPPVDIDALASIVVAVSKSIAGATNLREFEVNPIRVAPEGALAVDALAIATEPLVAETRTA